MKEKDENQIDKYHLEPMMEEMRGGVSLTEAAGLLMGVMRDFHDVFKDVKRDIDKMQDGKSMTSNSLDISRLFRQPKHGSFPRVERFHKEVKMDDVKGVSELVSMMGKVGGRGRR